MAAILPLSTKGELLYLWIFVAAVLLSLSCLSHKDLNHAGI